MIWIGIDTGTHTGFAVWDGQKGMFLTLETLPIHQALQRVLEFNREDIFVVFEDARQRKWYGKENTTAKLQGAGSVKRDCSIWEDFLTDHDIPFRAVPPRGGCTKWSDAQFKAVTGWKGRTSEHARDAAVLVFGR